MDTPIGVTGATGHVGGRVARILAEAGVRQRLIVRSPDRAPNLPGTAVVEASYGDADRSAAALEGVELLFMVSGTESADRVREHLGFVDAARAAGVQHIVYTSFQSAAPDAVFTLARDHFVTEQHIEAAGIAFTFLRDSLYSDFLAFLPGEDGVIRGPAGDGRVAAVARADVARTAAAILLDPDRHRGEAYTLTGPQALTLSEVAAILTEHGDRPITFHDETLEEAYRSRERFNASPEEADAWVSTYTAIAAGALAPLTDDIERITGRAPQSLTEVLQAG